MVTPIPNTTPSTKPNGNKQPVEPTTGDRTSAPKPQTEDPEDPAQAKAPDSQTPKGAIPVTRWYGIPHLDTAQKYIGLQESNNRGWFFDKINRKYAYLGAPYCASFVSYCLDQGNVWIPKVRGASSRSFIVKVYTYTANEVLQGRYKPRKGDLIIWIRSGGGHIGFISEDYTRNSFTTIEANTSPGRGGNQWNGGPTGGVWRRTRSIEPMNTFRITHFTIVRYMAV